jgi:VanZ family protein
LPFDKKILWNVLFLGWFFGIMWLSLKPSLPSFDVSLLNWDKFQHAAAFGLLTFLGGQAFQSWSRSPIKAWTLAFLVALSYGAFIEIAQATFTSVRAAEWGDLVADALGAGIVYAVALLRLSFWKRQTT